MKITDKLKEKIEDLRYGGCGYTKIAKKLNLSTNTIKSYCQRNGLGENGINRCLNCGVIVKQNPKRKKKKFCSDQCRLAWWNKNSDLINKKANYKIVCKHCGKEFESYGNACRQYCSHDCYIKDRFYGDADE